MSDRLLHTKVSKRKPLTHFPKKEDGHDGDMQIVSISGKGTYLCIKDKSEWKISDKFNLRNKFDTHIFDEITTRKIKGKGGLGISIPSESVTSINLGAASGGLLTSTTIQPVVKVGDGTNQAIISTLNDKALVLKSKSSNPTQIIIHPGANIVNQIYDTGQYVIAFDKADTALSGMVRIFNSNNDATAYASVNIETKHGEADAFVRYIHRHDSASSQVHWCHGMDGDDSDKFNLNYYEGGTLVTPSTSTGTNFMRVFECTKTGDVTIGNDLTVTGDVTVTGADVNIGADSDGADRKITFGHSTLKTRMGIDDSADAFVINTDATFDATLANNSFSIDASHNVIIAGTLTIGSIATDTAGDNYLVEVSGVVKKRTPAETLADIGAQATVTAGTNCTFSGATLNVDDAFIKNDADDTMAGTLTIDKNTTATATATVKGAFIDYDHTGISASGQTITGIGLDLDMDCGSATHVGTVNQTGIDINMDASDDGTAQTNTGIDIFAAGGTNTYGMNISVPNETGDYHIKLMDYAEAAYFATFHVTNPGNLTIDTAADLKLDTATGITRFYLAGDTNDYASLTVAANGVTTLATFDDGGTIGHLTLDPDGDLLLQPATHTYSALPIGFTQDEPTFNATDTIITFSTKGNKAKLTLTDNCTDIHFKFPAVSGNFVCVLLQDGTGGRTISNWKTQDSAGNAGAGNSGLVLWAGGTAPSNTETADKADIASFYWDADNEIAYGNYSYNF